MKEIQVWTKLPMKQVKDSLVVLIQQNIVTAVIENTGEIKYQHLNLNIIVDIDISFLYNYYQNNFFLLSFSYISYCCV